jgi:hypothetical protein
MARLHRGKTDLQVPVIRPTSRDFSDSAKSSVIGASGVHQMLADTRPICVPPAEVLQWCNAAATETTPVLPKQNEKSPGYFGSVGDHPIPD